MTAILSIIAAWLWPVFVVRVGGAVVQKKHAALRESRAARETS